MNKEEMIKEMQAIMLELDNKQQIVSYSHLFVGLQNKYPELSRDELHSFITNNMDALIATIEAQRLIN